MDKDAKRRHLETEQAERVEHSELEDGKDETEGFLYSEAWVSAPSTTRLQLARVSTMMNRQMDRGELYPKALRP